MTMGGVFAANMTGNTVLAGIALARFDWSDATRHLATLIAFFAGALLAPKQPFRRFLARESYRVEAGEKFELTPAVGMRRDRKSVV